MMGIALDDRDFPYDEMIDFPYHRGLQLMIFGEIPN
jgi:hypothetical protein